MPGIERDVVKGLQRVDGRRFARRCRQLEEVAAAHGRQAIGQKACQGIECRQRGRPRSVCDILHHGTEAARLQVDEVRYVARRGTEADLVAVNRFAVEKLCRGPDRCDGRQLVDDNLPRRIARPAEHREQSVLPAPLRDHIDDRTARARSAAKTELPVGVADGRIQETGAVRAGRMEFDSPAGGRFSGHLDLTADRRCSMGNSTVTAPRGEGDHRPKGCERSQSRQWHERLSCHRTFHLSPVRRFRSTF